MAAPPEVEASSTTPAGTGGPAADTGGRTRLGDLLHYAGTPLVVGAALIGLYLWVQGLELDVIEARQLRREVLTGQLLQHLRLTIWSTVIVLALAIPLGIVATRTATRRLAPAIIGLGNAGQAIPSLGLLALIFFAARNVDFFPSTGTIPVVAALVGYSFLPILRNTMVGLDQVDAAVLEAGRGMGLSSTQILRRIELPLAVPVILAGVRTALVLNVGTATLAFLFGGGGLGRTIFQGFGLQRLPLLVTGAVLVSALALLIDWLAGLVEERLTPRGL
ncbi:ABC transporter permease [Egicoccus halophilus]|uniref:Permease n=1 Tax=Egicoccus halophilus TaxID=1670830 RepID=A0A8J3A694_9ACTN|nr:ABC transporter permease [Egicoccus halophilus]GGI04407.1 permease [Egicoccus halophilus]